MSVLTSERIEHELNRLWQLMPDEPDASEVEGNGQLTQRGALRQAYTLGRDQGTAETMARAAELVAQPVADAQVTQLGASLTIVLAWCALVAGRSFDGLRLTTDGRWLAGAWLAQCEPSPDGFQLSQVFGADAGEALSKLATWCTEHTTAQSVSPTEPPAANPPPLSYTSGREYPSSRETDS